MNGNGMHNDGTGNEGEDKRRWWEIVRAARHEIYAAVGALAAVIQVGLWIAAAWVSPW